MQRPGLLVIDPQKIYTTSDSELYCRDSKATIERINQLIEHFEQQRLPIILVRHIHKVDGSDLGRMFDYLGEPPDEFNFKADSVEIEYDDRLRRPKRAEEIVKNRYSAFAGTSLETILKAKKISTIVICGFMTNFCCESTARDAHDRDLFVDFILDATGTPGTDTIGEKEMRRIVGELLEAGFARVHKAKAFLKSWKA